MKKFNFIALTPLLVTPMIAPIATSCKLFDDLWTMPRAIDGSNWTGVLAGKFLDSDYSVDTKEKTVHYWNGIDIVAENLVVPNYVWYNGEKFKIQIDPICFTDSTTIVGSVELNDWMTELPSYVFNECKNITSIIFHDYPTAFGDYALNGCISLTDIYVKLPNKPIDTNWNLYIEKIGKHALADTALYGTLVLTDSVKELGEYAFFSCDYLTSVNLRFASNLETIAPWCFANCSLLKSVSLPETVSKIDNEAFFQCTKLEEVVLSKDDQEIDFGDQCFFNCENFVNFSLEPIVHKIGESCFYGNKNINFTPWLNEQNDGLEIGASAFAFCGFRGLEFNPNVNIFVDSFAFADCLELKTIDFSKYNKSHSVPEWFGEDIFTAVTSDGFVVISQDILDDVHAGGPWSTFFTEHCGLVTMFERGWEFKVK